MAFSSKRIFFADPVLISSIADEIAEQFVLEGYTVNNLPLASGGADVSITKGGVFKAVLGMKTALKIVLKPAGDKIVAEAGVGIFGQQVVPSVISLLFFWPVIITQLWGMIQQSKLDDHAMELIEMSISRLRTVSSNQAVNGRFCPNCGNPVTGRFCASCGQKLD